MITQEKHDELSTQIAYIHGRIEAQIEAFALALGVPSRELAFRLAALLQGKESRGKVGAVDRVPSVPGAAQGRTAVAEMEVAQRPPRKTYKISKEVRKRMAAAQKKRYAEAKKGKAA